MNGSQQSVVSRAAETEPNHESRAAGTAEARRAGQRSHAAGRPFTSQQHSSDTATNTAARGREAQPLATAVHQQHDTGIHNDSIHERIDSTRPGHACSAASSWLHTPLHLLFSHAACSSNARIILLILTANHLSCACASGVLLTISLWDLSRRGSLMARGQRRTDVPLWTRDDTLELYKADEPFSSCSQSRTLHYSTQSQPASPPARYDSAGASPFLQPLASPQLASSCQHSSQHHNGHNDQKRPQRAQHGTRALPSAVQQHPPCQLHLSGVAAACTHRLQCHGRVVVAVVAADIVHLLGEVRVRHVDGCVPTLSERGSGRRGGGEEGHVERHEASDGHHETVELRRSGAGHTEGRRRGTKWVWLRWQR